MAEPRIVVVGVASLCLAGAIDTFPLEPGRTRFAPWLQAGVSGVGANVASALDALGSRVDFCTVIGEDTAGEAIRSALSERDLLGPGTVAGAASSLSVSVADGHGQACNLAWHRPVNDHGYPVEVFERLIAEADLVVLTTAAFTRALLESARRAAAPVAVDAQVIDDLNAPQRRAWLEVADIIFCSDERLPCAPREWVARVFRRYPGCLVAAVGCGASGAVLGAADGRLVHARTPAPEPIRNTSGAGDTLFATFLHSWLAAGNPLEALADGIVHAAHKIGTGHPGLGHLDSEGLADLRARHPVEFTLGRWK